MKPNGPCWSHPDKLSPLVAATSELSWPAAQSIYCASMKTRVQLSAPTQLSDPIHTCNIALRLGNHWDLLATSPGEKNETYTPETKSHLQGRKVIVLKEDAKHCDFLTCRHAHLHTFAHNTHQTNNAQNSSNNPLTQVVLPFYSVE